MAHPYVILAYQDRQTWQTLCPDCAVARFGLAVHLPEYDTEDRIGEIYRHDLDPDDVCPCSVCGTVLAPENASPEGE